MGGGGNDYLFNVSLFNCGKILDRDGNWGMWMCG